MSGYVEELAFQSIPLKNEWFLTSDTLDAESFYVCRSRLERLRFEIERLDQMDDVQKREHARKGPVLLSVHWTRHDARLMHNVERLLDG